MQKPMTNEQRASMIADILAVMKFNSAMHKKFFDYGDTFFALAFRTDEQLKKIAAGCGL